MRSSRTFQTVAAAVGWALLLIAVGLGYMGYRIFHVDGPGAQRQPKSSGSTGKPAVSVPMLRLADDGTHTGPIEHGLTPYTRLWIVGGDDGERGVSGTLSREEVAAALQEDLDRMAATYGNPRADAVEVMRQQGWDAAAFRKYRGESAAGEVRIQIMRMAPTAAKTANDDLRRAGEPGSVPLDPGVAATDVDVWCAMRAGDPASLAPETVLPSLDCGAVVGDIQIRFTAVGSHEGSLKAATVLLQEQVDHLRKGGGTA